MCVTLCLTNNDGRGVTMVRMYFILILLLVDAVVYFILNPDFNLV